MIKTDRDAPFFSVCIPQYNRTSFLLEALNVLKEQTFKSFEICISDGGSTDGRENELNDYLRRSGLSFVYKKHEKNLKYDANMRASIALAKGEYCLLHCNDDCLASSTTLEMFHREITSRTGVGVVTTNFEFWKTGEICRRIRCTQLVGSGPEVMARHFRNLAFVSGVVIMRKPAQQCATDRWDGSEMYQMFLAGKLIGSGKFLLELETSTVRKDIQVQGETVDSYAKRPKVSPCPIIERQLALTILGRVVADSLEPFLEQHQRSRILTLVFQQLYLFTFPFWIIEYRRVQSWKYAAGICIGLKPRNVFLDLKLGVLCTLKLQALYLYACFIGLFIPRNVFNRLKPFAYQFAKTVFSIHNKARVL